MLEPARTDLRSVLPRLSRGAVVIEFEADDVRVGMMPSRIIVPNDWLDEFFAWSSTYVEGLSPLTAFIDVWSADEALESRRRLDLTIRQKGALIGAALMDALLQSKSRMKVPDSILPAALRTLSAVFVQTINIGRHCPSCPMLHRPGQLYGVSFSRRSFPSILMSYCHFGRKWCRYSPFTLCLRTRNCRRCSKHFSTDPRKRIPGDRAVMVASYRLTSNKCSSCLVRSGFESLMTNSSGCRARHCRRT